jgi:hypothetical protein
MEYHLNIFQMQDGLIFFQMKNNLVFVLIDDQYYSNGLQPNILADGRQPKKKIIQPKTIKIKTIVVALLRVT